MDNKNYKCADIIKLEFQDRKETISDLFELKNDFAHCDDVAQAFNEFGLSIDYIEPNTFDDQKHGYWRYQLSWGGPSDELRYYLDDNKQLYKSEYCYKEWFDGAVIDVSDEPIINDLWYDFIEWTLPL